LGTVTYTTMLGTVVLLVLPSILIELVENLLLNLDLKRKKEAIQQNR